MTRGRPRTAALAAVIVAIAVAMSMCVGESDLVGEKAKDFTVVDVDGVPHNLTDYRGRVLVVDFFATWCGPCASQHAELEELWPKLNHSKVAFLQIDSDDSESVELVTDYRDDRGVPWPVAPGGGAVADDYKVDAIPTIVVIDKKGVIQYYHVGVVRASDLKDVVQDLL